VVLVQDHELVQVSVLHLHVLLDQLRAFRKHLPVVEEEIKAVFATHPEAYLFRDLPGAGASWLLACALPSAPCVDYILIRQPAKTRRRGSGAGEKRQPSLTHWRWLAPTFLRQTFVEWAGQTVVFSAWAKVYYQRMIAKGTKHHAVLRALAFSGSGCSGSAGRHTPRMKKVAIFSNSSNAKAPTPPPPKYYDRSRQKIMDRQAQVLSNR